MINILELVITKLSIFCQSSLYLQYVPLQKAYSIRTTTKSSLVHCDFCFQVFLRTSWNKLQLF